MNNALISKGSDLIRNATELDEAGELHDALKFYELGLEALISAMKNHKTKSVQSILKTRVTAYLSRAEELKRRIAAGEEEKVSSLDFPSPPSKEIIQRAEKVALVEKESSSIVPSSRTTFPDPPTPSLSTPHSPNSSFSSTLLEIEEGESGRSLDSVFGSYFQSAKHQIELFDRFINREYKVFTLLALLEVLASRRRQQPRETIIKFIVHTEPVQSNSSSNVKKMIDDELRASAAEFNIDFSLIEEENQEHDRYFLIDNQWKIILGVGIDFFLPPPRRLHLGLSASELKFWKKQHISFHQLKPN